MKEINKNLVPMKFSDKATEEIVQLKIPKGMRLGQVIMNAYRGLWFENCSSICDNCRQDIFYDGKLPQYCSECLNKIKHSYWDIWEEDEKDIQKRIDDMNKKAFCPLPILLTITIGVLLVSSIMYTDDTVIPNLYLDNGVNSQTILL